MIIIIYLYNNNNDNANCNLVQLCVGVVQKVVVLVIIIVFGGSSGVDNDCLQTNYYFTVTTPVIQG